MLTALACFHYLNIIHCSIISILLLTLSPSIVHSLNFSITSFSDAESASNKMEYEGDAKPVEGSIELTTNDHLRVGRAIYGQPLHVWDSSTKVLTDFSTLFSFTIYETTNITPADGFAFYMAPLGYQIPANSFGEWLGLFNSTTAYGVVQNHVFMVEFDTYVNNEYDPKWQHVGINSNSIESINSTAFDIQNNYGKKVHAWITYNSSTKTLVVSWSFNETSTTTLRCVIDLMEILPEYVTVGFSATTGAATYERNVIHSWDLTSTLDSTNSEVYKKNKKQKMVILIVAVASSIVLVLVIVSVFWSIIIFKKRRMKVVRDDNLRHTILVASDLNKVSIPRSFDYKELVAATNGFSEDRRLGRGGSGQVYKGVLSDLGRVVAVKRIFADFQSAEKIFTNEVKIISRLIHKNLVQFIGWCHEKGEFLLIFEYMPNGSLDTHLFGNKRTLAWDVRYKIALGIATALHYLHEDAQQCVLHRDIKSANVLLDTNFSTKLGDFGTAKLVDPRLKTQRTGVVGTYGYLAPEYINEGKASKESDMYSFGVVALEIACGRRTYQDGEYHVPLVNWVWQLYVEGNILNGADEGLNKIFDVHQMTCLLIVGLWCTHPNDKERPKAAQVIKVLQLESPLHVLPIDMDDRPLRPTNGQSRYFFQSSPITSSLVNDGR